MWTISKNNKCCASCANWGGDRKPIHGGRGETDSPSTRGKCYAGVPADATQGHTAMQGTSCGKYTCWAALK